MKYSKLFGKTLRSVKKDIVLDSHRLLYQGGFIRELSAGRYEFLPLGLRVQQKIIDLIDKEMEKIGSQRMSIPILQPLKIWQKTNRDGVWGSSLMRLTDRNNTEFALSATGEGVVTEMVARSNPTYKDLPVTLHQFIMKFRDELRPRGGLIRVREFIMKDAYSYHTTEEDLMETYEDFHAAYTRIFDRLDLPDVYPVIADSGALGGAYSHEFQMISDAGEDKFVKCDTCDYAANVEKAVFERESVNEDQELKEYEVVELPAEVCTMKQLEEHYGLPPENYIKNVMYKAGDGTLIIATVTGNLDVNEVKLTNAVGKGPLEMADDEDLNSIGSKHGYLHSWGYDEHKDRIIYVVDLSLKKARNLYGGYKTDTTDPINVNYPRDFQADIEADIAESPEGAKCAQCKDGHLHIRKSIELGHIFKYDHFYTKAHDAKFVDKDGKNKYMWSGAYGIGIGRAMAASVEAHHDDAGIVWPAVIAPYHVHLVQLGDNAEITEYAESLYSKLREAGVEVLWDDRTDVSAGVKFADADLIGNPIRVVVSARGMDKGTVEVKKRGEQKSKDVKLDRAVEEVRKILEELLK